MRSVLSFMVLCWAGSVLAVPPAPEGSSFITGGAQTDDFEQVVQVEAGGSACTGTVIGADGLWVLTSGSCLPVETPDDGVVVRTGPQGEGPAYSSVAWMAHADGSVGVVKLGAPIDVPAMALNLEAMDDAWLALGVDLVGYGATAAGAEDAGVRRTATTEIVQVGPSTFETWSGAEGLCDGDAGAPAIVHTGSGYAQIGVGSSVDLPCGLARDTWLRTDTLAGWLTARGVPFTTPSPEPPELMASCRLAGQPDGAIEPTHYAIPPVSLSCTLLSSPVGEPSWDWGDGTRVPAVPGELAHQTWSGMGEFGVRVCVRVANSVFDHEACKEVQSVVTCPDPDATFEVSVDGQNVSVATSGDDRCTVGERWIVKDAAGEEVASSTAAEPSFVLDKGREYHVTHEVESRVGSVEATQVVALDGGGCSALAAPALGAWAGLFGLVLLARRRP